MKVLKPTDPATLATQIVGYINRRTGEAVCPEHGGADVGSPRSPWSAVGLVERPHARYEATAPLICHACGAWLNNESTCYATVSPADDSWTRWLRIGLGHHTG
jgi:hypothetical protein